MATEAKKMRPRNADAFTATELDRFNDVMQLSKGLIAHNVAMAFNRLGVGIVWSGCSKSHIAESWALCQRKNSHHEHLARRSINDIKIELKRERERVDVMEQSKIDKIAAENKRKEQQAMREAKKRYLHGHEVNPANKQLEIAVTDDPGAGGANQRYEITGLNTRTNPSVDLGSITQRVVLLFQNGPIPDKGVNGITHEALLAIIIDRLQGFQSGKFACDANEIALRHIEAAQDVLKFRTESRINRGVEGTHTV